MAVHPHALVMTLAEQSQERRSRDRRVRVVSDNQAPLVALCHLELGVPDAYPPSNPADLFLRLEALDIEIGAKSPSVELHACLASKDLDGCEVDDQHVRVVEICASLVSDLEWARCLALQAGDKRRSSGQTASVGGFDFDCAIDEMRADIAGDPHAGGWS